MRRKGERRKHRLKVILFHPPVGVERMSAVTQARASTKFVRRRFVEISRDCKDNIVVLVVEKLLHHVGVTKTM